MYDNIVIGLYVYMLYFIIYKFKITIFIIIISKIILNPFT